MQDALTQILHRPEVRKGERLRRRDGQGRRQVAELATGEIIMKLGQAQGCVKSKGRGSVWHYS